MAYGGFHPIMYTLLLIAKSITFILSNMSATITNRLSYLCHLSPRPCVSNPRDINLADVAFPVADGFGVIVARLGSAAQPVFRARQDQQRQRIARPVFQAERGRIGGAGELAIQQPGGGGAAAHWVPPGRRIETRSQKRILFGG